MKFNVANCQKNKCGFYKYPEYIQDTRTYDPEATKFVNKCLQKLGVTWINIPVYTINNKENCFATEDMGIASIILDMQWMTRMRGADNWFHIHVIGHEIGHIILGHLKLQKSPKIELEADIIGAMLLKKFNYPSIKIEKIFPKELYTNIESNTHPKTVDRINVINKVLKSNTELSLINQMGWFSSSLKMINKDEQEKLNQLKQLCEDFLQNENLVTFEMLKTVINSLDQETFLSINVQDYININQAAIRFGLDKQEYCLTLLKLYNRSKNVEFLLEVGPYFMDLENSIQKDIMRSINIKHFNFYNFSQYQLLNYARLLIPFTFHTPTLSEFTVDFIQTKLPKKLGIDTNCIDYLSIMTIYSNFQELYHNANNYNSRAQQLISNLALNNPDPYYRFQEISILQNQALIEYRIGEFNKALRTLAIIENRIKDPSLVNYSFSDVLNDGHYLKARIYLDSRQYEKSLFEIQQYESKQNPFEDYIIGLIYFKNGDLKNAKTYFINSCNNQNSKSCDILKMYY